MNKKLRGFLLVFAVVAVAAQLTGCYVDVDHHYHPWWHHHDDAVVVVHGR